MSGPQVKTGKKLLFDVVSLKLDSPKDSPYNPAILFKLLMAKDLFCTALARMPKDYITRLVFNCNHEVACLFEYPPEPGESPLVGAICYRTFYEEGFVEIAFCAVVANRQFTGFGQYIMNHLKEYIKKKGAHNIVTYADNSAFEYFAKQGFTRFISIPEKVWHGRVKHYDGATFVQCILYDTINYVELHNCIRRQRETILSRLDIQLSHYSEKLGSSPDITMDDLVREVPGLAIVIEQAGGMAMALKNGSGIASADEVMRCNSAAMYAIAIECGKEYALPFLSQPRESDWQPNIVYNDLLIMTEKAKQLFYRTRGLFKEHARSILLRCQSYNGESAERTVKAGLLYKGLMESFQKAYDTRLSLEDALL